MRIKGVVLSAFLLLYGSTAVAQMGDFGLARLEAGREAFAQRQYLEAIEDFRVASFALLDRPARLLETLARLALAQSAAARPADERKATLERFLDVERQFRVYSEVDLEPDVRSAFETLLRREVPPETLSTVPQVRDALAGRRPAPHPSPQPPVVAGLSATPSSVSSEIRIGTPPGTVTPSEITPISPPNETPLPPLATPTPTNAATPTQTWTFPPSPTSTATPTSTRTPTETRPPPSATAVPTETATPTQTETFPPTPTSTATPTQTSTRTAVPPSATARPTDTATPTRTQTAVPPSPTRTPTRTATKTPTLTPIPPSPTPRISRRTETPEAAPTAFPKHPDRPPRPILTVNPVYPTADLKARIRGLVVLRVLVSETGTPVNVVVVERARGHLTEAAVTAVRQWRFEPAFKNGEPVRAWTTVRIPFEAIPFPTTAPNTTPTSRPA